MLQYDLNPHLKKKKKRERKREIQMAFFSHIILHNRNEMGKNIQSHVVKCVLFVRFKFY
jgi:hypothetical protein